MSTKLTGRTRHRVSRFRRRLILQVEVNNIWTAAYDPYGPSYEQRVHTSTTWRDARAEDFQTTDQNLILEPEAKAT